LGIRFWNILTLWMVGLFQYCSSWKSCLAVGFNGLIKVPMHPTYVAILILALLSGLSTLIGAAIAVCLGSNKKAIAGGLGFAAGIMLWISFFELVPESFLAAGGSSTFISLICGFLLVTVLDLIIPHARLGEKTGRAKPCLLKAAYLCAFGLIIHDFPEGFVMANSYIHSPSLGVLIAISIALHNIPEELAIAVPIILAGEKKRLLFKMAFLSGLAEPLGATLGFLFLT
jgi:ZIP family zinc transporter